MPGAWALLQAGKWLAYSLSPEDASCASWERLTAEESWRVPSQWHPSPAEGQAGLRLSSSSFQWEESRGLIPRPEQPLCPDPAARPRLHLWPWPWPWWGRRGSVTDCAPVNADAEQTPPKPSRGKALEARANPGEENGAVDGGARGHGRTSAQASWERGSSVVCLSG